MKLKNKTAKSICIISVFTMMLMPLLTNAQSYVFEKLGRPVRSAVTIEFVTNDKESGSYAWAGLTDAQRSALVGINTENGKLVEVDLTPYGKGNAVLLFKHSEKVIYIFAGRKGRFFKYDIGLNKLTPLGEVSDATYWMKKSYAIGADGKIYVGTFPNASVSVLDPLTDKVNLMKNISITKGSEYVINPASSKDGIIYLPTGMHHGELWSFNPKTQEKKQILPEGLQSYGPPVIWRAEDGNVYGKKGRKTFLCTPNGIEEGITQPAFKEAPDNIINGKVALFIERDGSLILEAKGNKERSAIKSTFDSPAHEIFSLGDVHEGKLYGSSIKPGHLFTYDTKNGEVNSLGSVTRGRIQAYDILSYKDGLFISSYTGGYIEYFDPKKPRSSSNPRLITQLHRTAKQERPVQLTVGPDGKIYSPTIPIKGYLGGVIAQIDPDKLTAKTFPDLIKNQTFTSITSVPETGELFVTSSVHGGSSAKPTEKTAFVFLWNPSTKEITYKAQPIEGANAYSKTVRAPNGIIYGFFRDSYYAFDPVKREIIFKGTSPGRVKPSSAHVILSEKPGSDGLLYGIDSSVGQIIAINPKNHEVKVLAQDNSLIRTRIAEVQSDGYLYYASHAEIMRVKVVK